MNKRHFQLGLAGLCLVVLLLAGTETEATIQRLDLCGLQFQRTQSVPVIREAVSFVTVRGDLVNTHTSIENDSRISISQTDSGGGGGLNTFVTLKITPSSSISPGVQTIKLHYAIELNGPDTFTINILAPKIDTITMAPSQTTVPQGTDLTFAANGSNLTGVHLNPTFSGITNIHVTSATTNRLEFTAVASRTFGMRSVNFNQDSLPDSCVSNHPAGNALLNVTVEGAPPPPIPPVPRGGGGGNPPPQQPDLSVLLLNTFRSANDFSNNKASTYNLCPRTTRENPKTTTIPQLTVRVLNSGNAAAAAPFTIAVTTNGRQTNTFTVNSLNAGATVDFVIPRAESRVCGTLDPTNPTVCHRCGSGVIPVWNDLGIQVTVDSGNTVAESNENNNVQSIQ